MPRKVDWDCALLKKVNNLGACFGWLRRRHHRRRRGGRPSLWDVDVGVLVPDEVDVGDGEVLADDLTPGAACLVVPLARAAVEEGHASLVAEAVVADGSVRLARGPVVVLKKIQ